MYDNDGLIFKNFIAYKDLIELIKDDENKFYNANINIFIDADSLYETYINISCINSNNLNPIHISSTILNMIGHYKHFFNRVCLVNSIKVFVIANSLPVGIAKKICDYIKNVYIISNKNQCSINNIPWIYQNCGNNKDKNYINTFSFVITNERYYCYQLPSWNDHISVLRIYSNANGCKYINSNTNLDDFNPKIKKYNPNIDNHMIPLISAYSNSNVLGLYTQYNIKKTIKILTNYIELGIIKNGYNHPLSIKNILLNDTIPNDKDETIFSRYLRCDLLTYRPRIDNSLWMIDKYARYEVITNICDEYFKNVEDIINIQFLING